jgi:hypothetical protein
MTSDERQLDTIPDEALRRPHHWKRWLHVALTLCACILVVVFGLNTQLIGILQGTLYYVLFFVTSTIGCEVFMVVAFVLAVRAMRQNLAFRRASPRYGRPFVWGSRLALTGLAPLAVGYFWFLWYGPGLWEGWRPPNNEFVVGIALLGAALVLLCIGIVLICVAFIWATWQQVRSVVRGPSGNSNA